MSEMKSCGRTMGHGDTCSPGYPCNACYDSFYREKRMKDLEEENAKFRECLNLIIAEIPHAQQPRKSGNAPGHCHEVPGVWDSDNGAKAGKECGWCKTWGLALSLS